MANVPEGLDGISAEDDRYIRRHFVTLERLVARTRVSRATLLQWRSQGLFPRPTYVTEDGERWYPRAYVPLVRRAISLKTDLKVLFREEYRRALEQLRYLSPADFYAELAKSMPVHGQPEDTIEREWQAFLTGEYGPCLRTAWFPCILRKGKLLRTIEELVAVPHVDAPGWRRRLRQSVDSLDRLEMPLTAWDQVRRGEPVSRDTHSRSIRQRFPEVFERPPTRTPPVGHPMRPNSTSLAAEC
jgi:hypothetical protein